MTFGVVNTGFNVKTLNDIFAEMSNDVKSSSNFGNDTDVSSESVFGQFLGIFAKVAADQWEKFGIEYAQQRISMATGVNLDYLVELNGITRLPATPTTVNVGLAGTDLALIPSLTQVKNNVTNELFQLLNDTTITNLQQLQLFITIDSAIDAQQYIIDINGDLYDYTATVPTDTVEDIAEQLVIAINADSGAAADATNLLNGRIQLDTATPATPFDTIVDANMTYYTPATFQSINTGVILAVANTLTVIETPVAGLATVNNFIDGTKGRDIETDAELRIRYFQSLAIIGGCTLEAIVAQFKQDTAIAATAVLGFENREDVADGEGRPPHSFEIVILSPDTTENDQLIADKLWFDSKPAGIETFGVNEAVDVTDSNGDLQTMNFTRPTEIFGWVRITYVLDPESVFPTDGEATIAQCVLDVGNTYTIGQNIKPLDFSCCVAGFPGVESAVIEVDGTATVGGPPTYSTAVKQIDDNGEIAVFDLTRIVVTV